MAELRGFSGDDNLNSTNDQISAEGSTLAKHRVHRWYGMGIEIAVGCMK